MQMRPRSLALAASMAALALGATSACVARPARFVDAPAVDAVADDAPIAVPRRREIVESTMIVDVYLRKPVLDALEARRVPDPGDVNALDEVPASSWFDPHPVDVVGMMRGPASDGAPVPPLVPLEAGTVAGASGIAVVDARGLRYELRVDPRDRAGSRTAAEAIGARLAWAVGYHVPGVVIGFVRLADFACDGLPKGETCALGRVLPWLTSGPPATEAGFRVSATEWPAGVDLGPPPVGGARGDDPNDIVPHRDRRTLRALGVFSSWMALSDLGPRTLRDVYEGRAGEGHVRHMLVGFDDALGAGAVVRPDEVRDPRTDGGRGFLWNLGTLGLGPRRLPPPTPLRWPSVGAFDGDVDPVHAETSMPFEPIERVTAADRYWMAKRIASVTPPLVQAAIDVGAVEPAEARDYVAHALAERAQTIVSHAFAGVTPLEVARVEDDAVVLRDVAIEGRYADDALTRYEIERLDGEGAGLSRGISIAAAGPLIRVRLEASRFARVTRYLVVRVRCRRDGVAAPRAFEAHFRIDEAVPARLVGVRH